MTNNTVNWTPGTSLETVERQVILAAFRHYRGNKTATAQSLGIAIRTLDNKLEKYQSDDTKAKEAKDAIANDREEFLKAQRGQPNNWKPKILPTLAKAPKKSDSNDESPESGLRMESVKETSAEQSMPLPIGKEVQEVSSGHGSRNRNGKRR